MLTLNQTAGDDRDIIWIVKIEGSSTYRLATSNITLSGNSYDGQILNVNERQGETILRFQKEIDITAGGGIGNIGTFSFGISRHNDNASFSNFFNDFYPATSQPYIVGKTVSIGIVWTGATLESQITWLRKGYIDSYSYTPRVMNFDCYDLSEIEEIELPYYKVQKEFDNEISYYLYAPEENYGQSIPIVYGSFLFDTSASSISSSWISEDWGLVPGIVVSEYSLNYLIASHKCKTTELALYKYIAGFNTYMRVTKSGSAITNVDFYSMNFIDGVAQAVGEIKILYEELAITSTVLNVGAVTNKDKTDSLHLTGELITLRIGGSSSTSEIGNLGTALSDVKSVWSSKMDATNNVTLQVRNNTLNPAKVVISSAISIGTTQTENASYSFGTLSDVKKDTVFPYSIEEVQNYEYGFDTGINNGDVFYGYLHLTNIVVSGVGNYIF